MNVGEVLPDSTLKGVQIYEFDETFGCFRSARRRAAATQGANRWALAGVVQTRFGADGASVRNLPTLEWTSVLTPEMLAVLLVVPEKLSAWGLYQYTQHLAANKQRSDRYEIALWKKLIYPFAALVMMALALPFAYLQIRTGGVGVKLFAGLMLGVLFHFLNTPVLARRGAGALAAVRGGGGAERAVPACGGGDDVVGGAALGHVTRFGGTILVPARRSCRNCRSRSTRLHRTSRAPGASASQAASARGCRRRTIAPTALEPSASAASA